jgi:hypothetical protein
MHPSASRRSIASIDLEAGIARVAIAGESVAASNAASIAAGDAAAVAASDAASVAAGDAAAVAAGARARGQHLTGLTTRAGAGDEHLAGVRTGGAFASVARYVTAIAAQWATACATAGVSTTRAHAGVAAASRRTRIATGQNLTSIAAGGDDLAGIAARNSTSIATRNSASVAAGNSAGVAAGNAEKARNLASLTCGWIPDRPAILHVEFEFIAGALAFAGSLGGLCRRNPDRRTIVERNVNVEIGPVGHWGTSS